MKITKARFQHATQLHINSMVCLLSESLDIRASEAYRQFVQSATYDLLMSEKSKLYTQSFQYVSDMYNSEVRNDWDRWLLQ